MATQSERREQRKLPFDFPPPLLKSEPPERGGQRSGHFDEARRRSQRVSRREVATEVKIRLNRKMSER